jgi:signal peptidase I
VTDFAGTDQPHEPGQDPDAPADGAGSTSGGTPQKHRMSRTQRAIAEWGIVVVGAVIVVVVVRAFLFQAYYIPSGSMEPTLKINDRVLVNKLSYKAHGVHHGDIVVFDRPTCKGADVPEWASCTESDKIKDLIKRVIALPGDTIAFRDGAVYVNGKRLKESYTHGKPSLVLSCAAFPATYQIPKGDVFVMGDNRTNSTDSRCFGPIHKSSIVGRAFIKVWPISRVGFL